MRKFAVLAATLFFALQASAFNGTWHFTDWITNTLTLRRVEIVPTVPFGYNGNNVIIGTRGRYTNDSTGTLTVSNMVPGFAYEVSFVLTTGTVKFTNCFDSSVTGDVTVSSSYACSGPLVSGPAATALDSRFVNVTGDTMTGPLTNNNGFYGNGGSLTNLPNHTFDPLFVEFQFGSSGSKIRLDTSGVNLYAPAGRQEMSLNAAGVFFPSNAFFMGTNYANMLVATNGIQSQGLAQMSFVTVTNGTTNQFLTAGRLMASDGNKAVQSVNGSWTNQFSFYAPNIPMVYDLQRDFGAPGDGDIMTNVTLTASSTTITVTGPSQKYGNVFTVADVGKRILIYGAGARMTNVFVTRGTNTSGVGFAITNTAVTTNCIVSTISAFNSGTSITIASNAPLISSSGLRHVFLVYGHDDTDYVQAWLNSSTNFWGAAAGTNDGVLTLPNKIFIVAGPIRDPQPTTFSTQFNNHTNSQLTFPDYPIYGDFTKAVVIQGSSVPTEHETIGGPSSFGSILWSFYVNTNNPIPYYNTSNNALIQLTYTPSFISCQHWGSTPSFVGTGNDGYTNNFNAFRPIFRNLSIRCAANPNINALDLRGATSAEVDHVMISCGVRTSTDYACVFTNASGLILPFSFCDPGSYVHNLEVNSFWNGVTLGEHVHIESAIIQACQNAIFCWSGGHGTVFDNLDPEGCHTMIYNYGGAFGIFGNITMEEVPSGYWWAPQLVVSDWNNSLHGEINVDTGSGTWDTGGTTTTSKSGAAFFVVNRHTTKADGTAYKQTYVNYEERIINTEQISGNLVVTNANTEIRDLNLTLNPGGAIKVAQGAANAGLTVLNANTSSLDLYLGIIGGYVDLSNPDSGTAAQKGTKLSIATFALTNTPASWPASSPVGGAAAFVMSNSTLYVLTTAPFSTAWAATNKIAP